MKKITREEFEKRVSNVSNDTIDVSNFEFENTQKSGLCRCKICGNEWYAKAYSILQGHGCRKCYDKRNSQKRLISLGEVQKRISESGSNAVIIGDYIDTKHKCNAKCSDCGNIWRPNVSEIMRGHSCPCCSKIKQGINRRLSEEEYRKRCEELYGTIYDLSELNYTTIRNNVYPICKRHGKVEINAYQFLKGNGCLKCKMHSGQNKLSEYLKKNDIKIEDEYNKFEWLKTEKGGRMSLDMYLVEYNIAIEYQGRQHFEPVDKFGGEKEFQNTKERDLNKKKACRKHGVELIYFIPNKYEKYIVDEDIYFTNKKKLLEYLENKTKCSNI